MEIEMARKLSDTVKLNLRFSEALRRKLERAAERNNQSMNLEIVARLEKSFSAETSAQWNTFVTMLIGGDKNAGFLQWLAVRSGDWNWSDDSESRQRMIEEIKNELEARSVQ
jgi:Arc-like DNA binding domain